MVCLALIEKEQPKATINEEDRENERICTCKADELSAITLAASRRARLAFCSPSAAITYKKKDIRIPFAPCHFDWWASYLGTGFSRCFGLCSHGPLQLDRQTNIFTARKRKRKFHPRLHAYNNYTTTALVATLKPFLSTFGSTGYNFTPIFNREQRSYGSRNYFDGGDDSNKNF